MRGGCLVYPKVRTAHYFKNLNYQFELNVFVLILHGV